MTGFNYDELVPHIFLEELGQPTKKGTNEWRWGKKGSFSLNIDRAVWYDFEEGEGGGVVAFIKRMHPNQPINEVLENKYGIPMLNQKERTIYNYGKGQVIRSDFPDGSKEIFQTGNTEAIKKVPYKYSDWKEKKVIVVVEGEKCVDVLWKLGVAATCNVGGANKWPDDLNKYFLNKDVIILPDNDEAGFRHALLVKSKLKNIAKSVKCILLDGLKPKGDIWDWSLNPENTSEKLKKILSGPESQGFGFSVLSIDDLKNLPKQEWLIEGLLPEIGVGSIYGPPASYKTFLALHIGLSVASGCAIDGRFVEKGKNVLYSAHEGFYGLYKRLKASIEHHNFGYSGFYLTRANKPLDLCNTSEIDALIEDGNDYDLIIIDSLVKAMIGVDENSNTEVSKALKQAERLANAKKCCVLLIDHSGKEKKGARGASAKLGNQDFCFSVKRHDQTDQISLKVEKQKDGQDNFILKFQAINKNVSSINDEFEAIVLEEITNSKLSILNLVIKFLKEKDGLTIDELHQFANSYNDYNKFENLNWSSFRDTISRAVRDRKLFKFQNKYYLKLASNQTDDILPPKGEVLSDDVG